ncbi:hypothetical protein K5L04_09430 [Flavobacterium psychrophilum]|uniref:hypothetical protein n=2 Tax=Flavobacterium psychrophilum TaxID=96345 RepID=UPI00090362F1|nr:hypothetical protein [Flavobacterium psychrophilum]ELY1979210.1 hypothetical protein [Flavobacterium psychrophilum]OJH12440.1 hypothetical protein FPG87_02030 [Flavobacterium psychrophilum]QZK99917.1 hypothetical protein K5L04_09430 [Flavobacterium psychrophilum]
MSAGTQQIDIKQLSPEHRKALKKQLAQEEKIEKQNTAKQRETLKQFKDDFTIAEVEEFLPVRDNIEILIARAFENHKPILDLECELNGEAILNQDSHSNSLKDGSYSFSIGYNMTDTFDGSEGLGVEKVKQYIDSQTGEDIKTQNLANALNIFLKPQPITGMLNPNSLKQLSKLRYDYDDELFTEGIEIIEKAAIKVRSSQFIEGWKMVTMPNGQFKKVKFRFSI